MVYLDRYGIAFRQNEKHLLQQDTITVYRPGNRIYPHDKWWKVGEVVKTRVIEVPWSDALWIYPIFSNEAGLVKITNITLLHDYDLADTPEILEHVKSVYTHVKDFSLLTKIDMEKIHDEVRDTSTQALQELVQQWAIVQALLPEGNVPLDELFAADKFSLSFINHDYAGITPKMRNFIAQEYGLDIKTSMVVIKAENLVKIFDILRSTDKYIWWGLGVGFKDTWRALLRSDANKYYVDPVADAMQSTNFIAHFGDKLYGYNSDAPWYCESLTDKFASIGKNLTGSTIVMLWAWGTARGIALELVHRLVKKLIIINRTLSKAQSIADHLTTIAPNVAIAAEEQAVFDLNEPIDAIINLSTKGADGELAQFSGLAPANVSVEENLLATRQLLQKFVAQNPQLIVSDINLTKSETTPLLDIAQELWLPTLDGKGMVVYQWVDAIWTVFGKQIIQKWWTKEDIRKKLIEKILHNQ